MILLCNGRILVVRQIPPLVAGVCLLEQRIFITRESRLKDYVALSC